MNKYQEAYERLTRGNYKYADTESVYEDLEVLRPLVERATLKKPIVIPYSRNILAYKCPNCGTVTYASSNYKRDYCGKCGQALNWSNEGDC